MIETSVLVVSARFSIRVEIREDVERSILRDQPGALVEMPDQLICQRYGVPLITTMDTGDDHAFLCSIPKYVDLQGPALH